jgi:hypothetical protein
MARAVGEDIPSEPKSSDEDEEDEEEEEEVIPPPHSPLHEGLPSFVDIFCRQAGIEVDARWPTRTRIETMSSIDSPPQPRLALVTPSSGG